MSRIGKRILTLPENCKIAVNGNLVTVEGPKGTLSEEFKSGINVLVNGNEITVECENNDLKNFFGTTNAKVANMLEGVSKGYSKKLEMIGVGYRFNLQGNKLVVAAGYSHPVEVIIPEGIKVECPSNTELLVSGIDKCLVGEFSANIRKIRKPEPYKGKGIRYSDEQVRRKEGKKASK